MLINVSHLKLSIRGKPILHDVELHMDEADIYGLLGPNGAGKSSTLSVITGLRARNAGIVVVAGHDPWTERKETHRKLGALPEQMGFYDWMSGPHYLDWFSRLYGRRLTDHELAAHLTQVGLDAQDRRPIGAYSLGMRQRLGLARALLNDPKVVALDEPTNGLDPRGRHEVHDILLGLSRSKRVGILLCTHLLDDVERLCTRIGILHRGRSVLEGRLADLKKRGGLEELYLQHTPEAA